MSAYKAEIITKKEPTKKNICDFKKSNLFTLTNCVFDNSFKCWITGKLFLNCQIRFGKIIKSPSKTEK